MGDSWGIKGFRGGGGEKPNIKQIVQKKNGQKISNIVKIGKKSEKSDFFTWAEVHKKGYFSELYPFYSLLNSIHLQLFCIRYLLHYFFI